MAKFLKDKKAWEIANPGGNYVDHNIAQAGRNLAAAPGNLWAGVQDGAKALASIPGQLGGLFSLGRAAAGF